MTRKNEQQKQQIMLEGKMAGIWKSFRAAGREKQAELADHTFSFHIDDTGTGWEYVHFVPDNKKYGFRISDIGPGVSAFVEAMTSLQKKESKLFTRDDGPGEYTRAVSRLKDVVYVEYPTGNGGFFLKYDYFRDRILAGYQNSIYGEQVISQSSEAD